MTSNLHVEAISANSGSQSLCVATVPWCRSQYKPHGWTRGPCSFRTVGQAAINDKWQMRRWCVVVITWTSWSYSPSVDKSVWSPCPWRTGEVEGKWEQLQAVDLMPAIQQQQTQSIPKYWNRLVKAANWICQGEDLLQVHTSKVANAVSHLLFIDRQSDGPTELLWLYSWFCSDVIPTLSQSSACYLITWLGHGRWKQCKFKALEKIFT